MIQYRKIVSIAYKMVHFLVNDVAYVISCSLLISLFVALIEFAYVDNKFLFGGDNVPAFFPWKAIKDVMLGDMLWQNLGLVYVPQLSIMILYALLGSIANFFAAFNVNHLVDLWLKAFVSSVIVSYAIYGMAFSLIDDCVRRRLAFRIFLPIFLVLYFFNPWATVNTFKSFIGFLSVQRAMYLFLLVFLIYVFYVESLSIINILLAASFTLALAGISPSGAVRLLATLLFLMVISAALRIIKELIKRSVGKSLAFISKFISKFILITIVTILPAVIAIGVFYLCGYYSLLSQRYKLAYTGFTPWSQEAPSFAMIVNSIRNLGIWIAHSQYMPYNSIYEHGLVATASMFWPIIAFLSILLIRIMYKNSKLIDFTLAMSIIAVIAIYLEKSGNDPFPQLYLLLYHHFRLVTAILNRGSMYNILSIVYPILSALTLTALAHKALTIETRIKRGIMFLVFISLFTMLMISATPIFNGQVFGEYFNESIKGFFIPSDYFKLSELELRPYEHILLLPHTGTYASTTWGWQGSTQVYRSFNPSILVSALAPYATYSDWSRIYKELTMPNLNIAKGLSIISSKYILSDALKIYGATALNKTIGNGILLCIKPQSKVITIVIPFKKPLNISMYRYINFRICASLSDKASMTLMVFLFSGKIGGAHILGEIRHQGCVSKTYFVGYPDKPWPASRYNPSYVTGVVVKVWISRLVKIITLNISIIASDKAYLPKDWYMYAKLINIKYIALDKCLKASKVEMLFAKSIIELSKAKLVYKGKCLGIYELSTNSSLYHEIRLPSGIHINVYPLLYLQNPRVWIEINHEAKIIDFNGLVATIGNPHVKLSPMVYLVIAMQLTPLALWISTLAYAILKRWL